MNPQTKKGCEAMGVNFESFQDVLKHPIRRKIIVALSENPSLTYTDLMRVTDSRNTGKFNYHLKVLADLIEKDENGKYGLTEKGRLAVQFLQTFKEKQKEPSPLRMADASLIGFAGFVVTLANPVFWVSLFFAQANVKSYPLFMVLMALSFIFALVIPGFLMWRSAVRRSHSHDAYDLYKAPLFTFLMLLALLILMVVFNVPVGKTVSIQIGPTISGNVTLPTTTPIGSLPTHGNVTSSASWSKSTYAVFPVFLATCVGSGLVFSFIGVALSELGSRIKRKIT
jgi:predicted transcriptional regulator